MKKILVIDGQGGKLGRLLIEALVEELKPLAADCEIAAIGTNSIATANMLKAGASWGATGENPVLINCEDASYIMGPIGIITENALHGEVTPAMASAVGRSGAKKILIPISRCNIHVAGVAAHSLPELVRMAVEQI